jgi:hypothetical protein
LNNYYFNWEKFIEDSISGEITQEFDEIQLYRQIRRDKIIKKSEYIIRPKYCLVLNYIPEQVEDKIYKRIMRDFLEIEMNNLEAEHEKLATTGKLEWHNLTATVADILTYEIRNFLKKYSNNGQNIVKKVIEDAFKESRGNIT